MTRGRIASRTRAPGPPIPSSSSSHSSPDALERTLERKPSQSYAHNRNTSIVHGVQHSRNTSYVNSPATSPLSEHAQVITGLDGAIMSQDSITAAFSAHGVTAGPGSANGFASSALSPGAPGDGTSSSGQRKPERAPSRSSRKGQGHVHHRSQSRHHQQHHELKTVGEYALHHLFNSFISQADQKIIRCMTTDRSQPEAEVEFICGPGVDPNFDQLIAALGHIARHKPKPLIDTIMLWRKAKSEEASKLRTQLQTVRQPGFCRICIFLLTSIVSTGKRTNPPAHASPEHRLEPTPSRESIDFFHSCRRRATACPARHCDTGRAALDCGNLHPLPSSHRNHQPN